MLEYVFFDQSPYQQFVDFIQDKGIAAQCSQEEEIYQVDVPEDISEDLVDEIEEFYDQMMSLNQALFEQQNDNPEDYQQAGVVVSLNDGQNVYANVDGHLLAKIMSVLTAEEFGQVVESIVEAVEEPDNRPLCKRQGL